MDNIRQKISNFYHAITIPKSEFIHDIECVKDDPGFDINGDYSSQHNSVQWIWSLLMFAITKEAIQNDGEELVRYLLSFPNININKKCSGGGTALHYTINISIIKLLLDRKDFYVNTQVYDNGWTHLHTLCRVNRIMGVKELLLDARINTYIRDNDGETSQDIALKWGHVGIAKIVGNSRHTTLLRIPNASLCRDIARMIIEEYT